MVYEDQKEEDEETQTNKEESQIENEEAKSLESTKEETSKSKKVEDLGSVVRTVSNYTSDELDETATQKLLDETKGINPKDPDTTLVKSSNPQVEQDLESAKRVVDNVKLAVPPIQKETPESYTPTKTEEYKPEPSESPIKENLSSEKKEYLFPNKEYKTVNKDYKANSEAEKEEGDNSELKNSKKEEKYS